MRERSVSMEPWAPDCLSPRITRLMALGGSTLMFVSLAQAVFSTRVLSGRALDAATLLQSSSEGSLTNRVIMIVLAASALPLILNNRERVIMLLGRSGPLLLLAAWFLTTMLWSEAPDLTVRRLIRYVIFLWIAWAAVTSMRSFVSFFMSLVALLGAVVIANIAVAVLLPSSAFTPHGFAGIHVNKNTAGPFALLGFVALSGACLAADKWLHKLLTAALCTAAFVILILTKSETSIALLATVPLALGWFFVWRRTGYQGVLFGALLLTILGMSAMAMALTDTWPEDILGAIFKDATLTGRTEVWALLTEKIRERPLLGFGWGAFWGTTANPIEASRTSWLSQIDFLNTGHNGYLDLTLEAGSIGLLLSAVVVIHCVSTLLRLLQDSPPGSARALCVATSACLVVLMLFGNMTESLLFMAGSQASAVFVFIYLAAQAQRASDKTAARIAAWPVAVSAN